MGACRQHQRPRKPEMREQHLSELAEKRFFLPLLKKRERTVFKRQPHSRGTFLVLCGDHRTKRRRYRSNGMPRLFCEPVTVAGRACFRVRPSACGNDHVIGEILPCPADNAFNCAVLYYELFSLIKDCEHTRLLCSLHKCVHYLLCAVADGKYPVSTFGFEPHSEFLKKALCVLRSERIERREHKPRVSGDIVHHRLRIAVVGDVTSALSCYGELFPAGIGMLDKKHSFAHSAQLHRTKQSRSACAYHDTVKRHWLSSSLLV